MSRTPPRPSARRLAAGGAVVALAIALVLGGSAVVLAQAERGTPAALVERARSFAARQASVRFGLATEVELAGEGASLRRGAALVHRMSGAGEATIPGAFRLVMEDGEDVVDLQSIGADVFARAAADRAGVEGERLARVQSTVAVLAGRSLAVAAAPTTGADASLAATIRSLEPTRFADLLAASTAARRLSGAPGGSERIALQIDPARLPDGAGVEASTLRAEVDVLGTGEIRRLVAVATAPSGNVRFTYSIRAWDEPVQIAAPAPGALDPVPGIDEEALDEFDAVPVLQPRGVPEGWVLVGAALLQGTQTAEGCRQVVLDYEDPSAHGRGFLTLAQFPATCLPGLPPRAVPFSAGGANGFTVLNPADGLSGAITAGRTAIRFETNLTADDLAVVLSDLAPLDLGVAPVPLGGVGRRLVPTRP